MATPDDARPDPMPVEGRDYYIENGRWVFTARHHARRGHCCGSGCRHCPYDPPHVFGSVRFRVGSDEPAE